MAIPTLCRQGRSSHCKQLPRFSLVTLRVTFIGHFLCLVNDVLLRKNLAAREQSFAYYFDMDLTL